MASILLVLFASFIFVHSQSCVDVWDDPTLTKWSLWSGKPVAGASVTIPAGTNLLLDEDPPQLTDITIRGKLVVANISMTIDVNWIAVPGGQFVIGSRTNPNCRYGAKLTITFYGPFVSNTDPLQKGMLISGGGILDIHGLPTQKSWTTLASTAAKGATTLTLSDSVNDWLVAGGSNPFIVIASTDFEQNQTEMIQVASISGRTITLQSPLQHMHYGAEDENAEVGLLTRNIVIKGSNETTAWNTKFGGHIMMIDGKAFIEGVELTLMGQQGHAGRYPIHWHLSDDVIGTGQFFRDSAEHHLFQRCVTIHTTSGVLVQGIVAYETFGHCFFTEDGPETYNTFDRCLGINARPMNPPLIPSDPRPSIFWIVNPNNTWTNNVAVGGSMGYWFAMPIQPNGLSTSYTSYFPRYTPLLTFRGNRAHSSQENGMFIDEMQNADGTLGSVSTWMPMVCTTPGCSLTTTSQPWMTGIKGVDTVIEDYTAYKIRQRSLWARIYRAKFIGLKVYDTQMGHLIIGGPHVTENAYFVGATGNVGEKTMPWERDLGRTLPNPWWLPPVNGWQNYDAGGPQYIRNATFKNFFDIINSTNGRRLDFGGIGVIENGKNILDPNNKYINTHWLDAGTRVYLSDAVARGYEGGGLDNPNHFVAFDVDGSTTGQMGSFIVSKWSMHYKTPGHGCASSFPGGVNLVLCPSYPQLFTFANVENPDPGNTDYANTLNGFHRAVWFPFGSDGSNPTYVTGQDTDTVTRTRWSVNVLQHRGVYLKFKNETNGYHPTPPTLKFSARDMDLGNWLIFAVDYPVAPTSVVKGYANTPLSAATTVDGVDADHYFFDATHKILYVMYYNSAYSTSDAWGVSTRSDYGAYAVTVTAPCGKTCSVPLNSYIPPLWNGMREAQYKATLQGCQQTTPVSTAQSGTAFFTYQPSTYMLTHTIYHGLDQDLTALHIHNASAGSDGPVVYAFKSKGSPITGGLFLSNRMYKLLFTGKLYVNIHSAAQPAGLLRGQIACVGTCPPPKAIPEPDCTIPAGSSPIYANGAFGPRWNAGGWSSWRENSTVGSLCGTPFQQVNFNAWGGLGINYWPAFDARTFTGLRFVAKIPNNVTELPGIQIFIRANVSTSSNPIKLKSSHIHGYAVEKNFWSLITIPVSEFQLAGMFIQSVGFQCEGTPCSIQFDNFVWTTGYQAPVYPDDTTLTQAQPVTCTQAPVPTPVVAPSNPVPTPVVAPSNPVPTPVVAPSNPVPTPVVAPSNPVPAPSSTPVPTPVVAPSSPVPPPTNSTGANESEGNKAWIAAAVCVPIAALILAALLGVYIHSLGVCSGDYESMV